MKKYLFIILSIFVFFFFTDRVEALSYEVNDIIYQVTDTESLRDYCYFTYFKNSDFNHLFITFNSSNNVFSCNFYSNGNSNTTHYLNIYSSGNISLSFSSTASSTDVHYLTHKIDNSFINDTAGYESFNNTGSISVRNSNLTLIYNDENLYDINNNLILSSNYTFQDIENNYVLNTYTITYYLNNQVYQTITDVPEGSSHTLLYYQPSNEYNFSGWFYDNSIDLTSIRSDINIYGTTSLKPYYTITYYLNNQVYNTISVMEGTNYTLASYIPPRNYNFSGWSYDNNIDLTNIQSNVDIFGTTTYVRPSMNYSENINSIIHDISYQILGNSVPVEFDFLYTIMDFIILIIIICCVIAPFLILIKLLGGRF